MKVAQFLRRWGGLLVEGLDPKHELTNEHVTKMDIAKIFGNVKTFKTINPLILLDAKKEIEMLYWKIYGTWILSTMTWWYGLLKVG